MTQETVLKCARLCKSENPILTCLSICSDFWKLKIWSVFVESDLNSPFHLFASNLPHEKRKSSNVICTSWPLPLYYPADCKFPSCLPHYQNSYPGMLERIILCSFVKLGLSFSICGVGCKVGSEVSHGPLALMGLKSASLHLLCVSKVKCVGGQNYTQLNI